MRHAFPAAPDYFGGVPELWFFVGLAMGIVVAGFCAVGSFERGVDSVRRTPWKLELAGRRLAVLARIPAQAPSSSALRAIASANMINGPAATSRGAVILDPTRARRVDLPFFATHADAEGTRVAL
jgi:hypothetical protein